MKKLEELKNKFKQGNLSKSEYIDAMYAEHKMLFEYAELMAGTDIQKIEISDGEVLMTTKEAGIKMYCTEQDKRVIPIEILNFDSYEKEELDFVYKLLGEKDTIYDIGANFGWYSLNIAKRLPGCRILAFEPIPKTFAYLEKNLKANAISQVRIFNFGFSKQAEELSFYYNPEGSGNASLAKLSDSEMLEKVTCKVVTLDSFTEDNGVGGPDFIKCDVEGAELLVFQGGLKTLEQFKPIIFTEMLRKWSLKFNYHPNDIIALLNNLGYFCFICKNGGLEKIEIIDEETIETNFYFLHGEKHGKLIMDYSK